MTVIKIVTDSTVDLSEEMIRQYNIHVVPLSLTIEGETFLDRVDITPSQFIEKMQNSKELPKSSQPAVGTFLELYNQLGADGSTILSIHMTGKMSGTVRSAESAADMSESNVHVIDSRFISKGMGFQVIEAAKLAQRGNNLDSILAHLEEIRHQTKLFVVVDTLENLVKGGRIGKGRAMIGSLLNIKPIASLAGGEYTPVAKVRSHSQVIKYLASQFVEDIKGRTIGKIGLVHADGNELAQNLKKKLVELTGFDEIEIEETTPIISTHTGVGAIGFMYYLK
ncbi:DegV family protein with EDD domain [Bacillus pakistanensis]|uniref:DegV family protein with EDD domain n=1 Tax=Rossellomorea pakistanensis TaxID=992288 RepID=A0ABS2N8Y9_9BACI|nr:DegV family protein [Bacillus pakistanensis]MBM7584250.1 DegV family protein with EDD domain [Bacillus pakistanensis]